MIAPGSEHGINSATLFFGTVRGSLTLIYTGGGGGRPTLHFSGYISQTVKASLTKHSEFFHLAITLHLSLFGARSHV